MSSLFPAKNRKNKHIYRTQKVEKEQLKTNRHISSSTNNSLGADSRQMNLHRIPREGGERIDPFRNNRGGGCQGGEEGRRGRVRKGRGFLHPLPRSKEASGHNFSGCLITQTPIKEKRVAVFSASMSPLRWYSRSVWLGTTKDFQSPLEARTGLRIGRGRGREVGVDRGGVEKGWEAGSGGGEGDLSKDVSRNKLDNRTQNSSLLSLPRPPSPRFTSLIFTTTSLLPPPPPFH